MTETRTVPVADLLESLDFQPPCGADKCDQPASWVARMVCCGFMDLYCNDHPDSQVADIVVMPDGFGAAMADFNAYCIDPSEYSQ